MNSEFGGNTIDGTDVQQPKPFPCINCREAGKEICVPKCDRLQKGIRILSNQIGGRSGSDDVTQVAGKFEDKPVILLL
jgi:hypothetical protein